MYVEIRWTYKHHMNSLTLEFSKYIDACLEARFQKIIPSNAIYHNCVNPTIFGSQHFQLLVLVVQETFDQLNRSNFGVSGISKFSMYTMDVTFTVLLSPSPYTGDRQSSQEISNCVETLNRSTAEIQRQKKMNQLNLV